MVEQVRTEVTVCAVGERVTSDGFAVQAGPVGETSAERVTEPENPLMLVTVRVVEESDDPAGIVKDV